MPTQREGTSKGIYGATLKQFLIKQSDFLQSVPLLLSKAPDVGSDMLEALGTKEVTRP